MIARVVGSQTVEIAVRCVCDRCGFEGPWLPGRAFCGKLRHCGEYVRWISCGTVWVGLELEDDRGSIG